ncbi:MAG: hypothetical protein M1816_002141 [Peltula sp. TS41687]|nr:MAG: hypothetical protein M1816_002141 [Peltula sp. TS41687]
MATLSPDDIQADNGTAAQNSGGSVTDGQTPKRRGPKPDSKPALTRRQELNRQAQRTHRERKEHYVRALEQEVLRLRECVNDVNHEKNIIAEENVELKELLRRHGISFSENIHRRDDDTYDVGYTDDGRGPINNTPLNFAALETTPQNNTVNTSSNGNDKGTSSSNQPGEGAILDYDQIGIDFVLTLERPCMTHLHAHFDASQQADRTDQLFGHALLACTSPHTHPLPHAAAAAASSSTNTKPAERPIIQPLPSPTSLNINPNGPNSNPPTLQTPDLRTLLSLSQSLNLNNGNNGEITPVMAWCRILAHPLASHFTIRDFDRLREELSTRARCYGFGAVVEDFEVRDALAEMLRGKESWGSV